MPSYWEHRSNAVPMALIMGIAVLGYSVFEGYSISMSLGFSGIASAFVFIGTALPDVDHHASVPRRKAGAFAGVAVVCAYIYGVGFVIRTLAEYFRTPFIGFILFAVMVSLGISAIEHIISLVGEIFDSTTNHRGFTHTLVFALAVGVVVFYSPDVIANIEMIVSSVMDSLTNMTSGISGMITNIEIIISNEVENLVNMILSIPSVIASIETIISSQVERLINIVANDLGIRILIALSVFVGIYKHIDDDGIDI